MVHTCRSCLPAFPLTELVMTPLRQRFIQDLQLRNRSPKTVLAYVFHVRNFARFFGMSPDKLGGEHVHRYLLHLLHEKKASWAQYNQAVSALRLGPRLRACLELEHIMSAAYSKDDPVHVCLRCVAGSVLMAG